MIELQRREVFHCGDDYPNLAIMNVENPAGKQAKCGRLLVSICSSRICRKHGMSLVVLKHVVKLCLQKAT